MLLTHIQVKNILANAGFKEPYLSAAVKIAHCESGFNVLAHNTTGEDSRGLMQINVAPNANPQYANLDLFDPGVNARVAYEIFTRWGGNFGAWTCAKQLGLVNPLNNILGIGLAFITAIVLYLT